MAIVNRSREELPEVEKKSKPKGKRRKSAPGLVVTDDEDGKSAAEDEPVVAKLESTPTDNAALKRKLRRFFAVVLFFNSFLRFLFRSEPARKQMVLNLSPIQNVPPSQKKQKEKKTTIEQVSKSPKPAVNVTPERNRNLSVAKPASLQKKAVLSASKNKAQPTKLAPKPSKPLQPKLTIPTSPKFANRPSAKAVNYTPYEVKEKKMEEEMKKYRFRAQPVPKGVKVVNPGHTIKATAPPAQMKKAASVPVKKASPIKPTAKVESKNNNNNIGLISGGVSKKKVTVAKTPTFMQNRRQDQLKEMKKLADMAKKEREEAEKRAEKDKHRRFKELALRGPGTSKPREVPPKKYTQPKPFSFEEKDKIRREVKEHKIDEFLEEEKRAREFRANPLPNLNSVSGLPNVAPKPITRPEPFNLATDDRYYAAHTTWSTTIDSEQFSDGNDEPQYQFRARPMPDMSVPFVPERSHKEPTQVLPIVLHTEYRAEERKPFDEHLKIREEQLEEAKRQRELEMEEEEKRERARLRKTMVPKANPIRHYKPVCVEVARKMPTVPESPAFASKTRAQIKAQKEKMAALVEQYEEDLENQFNTSSDTYVV